MGGPDPYRNSRVKFARRSHTLLVKAHQLAKFCDADVYLVVNHQRGSFVYNSVEDISWPPHDEKLVSKEMPQMALNFGAIKLRDWQEQQYSNLERINFSKMETLPGSPESNLSRLTRYFTTRLEHFRLLENLYRDMDPANIIADEEALQIRSGGCD